MEISSQTKRKVPALALLGASIGNEQITSELVCSARTYLKLAGMDLNYMITGDLQSGGPGKWNAFALGYNESGARRSARSLTRRMYLLMAEAGAKESEFIKWEAVYCHPEYIRQRIYLSSLMQGNKQFNLDVRAETFKHLSLKHKANENISDEEMINRGTNYLLEELALLLAAPEIFEREQIIYAHPDKEWKSYDGLKSGLYDGIIRTSLQRIVLWPDWDFQI